MSALAVQRPPRYALSAVVAAPDSGRHFERLSGGEVRMRCPWHDDHRPSLRINDAKGVAFCDVCASLEEADAAQVLPRSGRRPLGRTPLCYSSAALGEDRVTPYEHVPV